MLIRCVSRAAIRKTRYTTATIASMKQKPGEAKEFSEWYTEALLKAEVLDYSDVSGCHILRPWGYSIWSHIQASLQNDLHSMGVQDAYFPLFIPEPALRTEQQHIEGFAPEVAWVTHAGGTPLNVRLAVRPTSETAIYPAYSRWIQSYRDLPLRLNQWCNIVRWEFANPIPLIRSREFLWQEGHSAFASKAEADKEVMEILELYKKTFEELLAVPMIPGIKTQKEKFAGADYTTTIEAILSGNGRAIQGATSHSLGQNFSRMFGIKYENEQGRLEFSWQNSWGFTTRSIGISIMTHLDEYGLVLPPNVAPTQVIIVPVGLTSKLDGITADRIRTECLTMVDRLKKEGIRAEADLRDHQTAGWKFNYWETKGVPLRLEVGPMELANGLILAIHRFNGERNNLVTNDVVASVKHQLQDIQQQMFFLARSRRDRTIIDCDNWSILYDTIQARKVAQIPWCETESCEEDIKQRFVAEGLSGVKSLCIPFKQPLIVPGRCAGCGGECKKVALFGRTC